MYVFRSTMQVSHVGQTYVNVKFHMQHREIVRRVTSRIIVPHNVHARVYSRKSANDGKAKGGLRVSFLKTCCQTLSGNGIFLITEKSSSWCNLTFAGTIGVRSDDGVS
jgi:hypothetical protein